MGAVSGLRRFCLFLIAMLFTIAIQSGPRRLLPRMYAMLAQMLARDKTA